MTSYIKCAAVDIIGNLSAPRSLQLLVLIITTALISSTHQQGVAVPSEAGEEAVDLPVDGGTGTEMPPRVSSAMVQPSTSNSTVDTNATTSAANGTTATSESRPPSSTNATTVVDVPIADKEAAGGGVGWVAGGLIIAGVVVALAALGACVVYRVRRKRGGGSLV